MQHKQALTRLRTLFRRDDEQVDTDMLTGPSLLEQEPDLAREAGRYTVATSAWAAGGQPTD